MWLTDYDFEKINEIKKCREKIKTEKSKIKDIEFNIKLYTEHILSQIHSMYTPFSINVLENLWRNFNKEEKDEDFKRYYKFINDLIVEDVIGDTKCIYKKTKAVTRVIVEGFSMYRYNVDFLVNNIEFCLYIPVYKNINEDTLVYADYGMYCLSYKKGCCSHIFAQSYDLRDIKKAFKECIENKKYEE